MPITPDYPADYDQLLFDFIGSSEGFSSTTYADTVGVPTVGYGCALLIYNNNPTDGVSHWQVRSDLGPLMAAAGIQVTADDQQALAFFALLLNDPDVQPPPGVPSIDELLAMFYSGTYFSWDGISEDQGVDLYNYQLAEFEQIVENRLGTETYLELAGSQEMVALVSLAYNSPSLIGNNLVSHITSGDRARAWAEIRFFSNADGAHTSRRIAEAELFGRYEPAPGPEQQVDDLNFYHWLIDTANGYLESGAFTQERYDEIRDLISSETEQLRAEYTDGNEIAQVVPYYEDGSSNHGFYDVDMPDGIDGAFLGLGNSSEDSMNFEVVRDSYIVSKEGDDFITMHMVGENVALDISAGAGNDYIYTNTRDSHRTDDIFETVNLIESIEVDGGDGDDSIHISARPEHNPLIDQLNVNGGDGADEIMIAGSAAQGNIDGGAGDDEIRIQPQDVQTGDLVIDGGSGNDQLSYNDTGTYQTDFDSLTFLGGTGDDMIFIRTDPLTTSTTITVDGGAGMDQVIVEGPATAVVTDSDGQFYLQHALAGPITGVYTQSSAESTIYHAYGQDDVAWTVEFEIVGDDLLVNGNILLPNFVQGMGGITLVSYEEATASTSSSYELLDQAVYEDVEVFGSATVLTGLPYSVSNDSRTYDYSGDSLTGFNDPLGIHDYSPEYSIV